MLTFEEAMEKVIDGPEEQTKRLTVAFEEEAERSNFIDVMCVSLVTMLKEVPRDQFGLVIRNSLKGAFVFGIAVGREMEKPPDV